MKFFTGILLRCLGQQCVLFNYRWENFRVTPKNCESLAQQIFPCLQYACIAIYYMIVEVSSHQICQFSSKHYPSLIFWWISVTTSMLWFRNFWQEHVIQLMIENGHDHYKRQTLITRYLLITDQPVLSLREGGPIAFKDLLCLKLCWHNRTGPSRCSQCVNKGYCNLL